MNIKSLLLGSAAALLAVSGARAADAVVVAEPEPMEYVRICDVYGTGFYYIPGTETCLKVGGLVRYQISFTDEDNGWVKSTTARLKLDARSETEYGTFRRYIELNASNNGGNDDPRPGHWADNSSFAVRYAYVELGGLSFGRNDTLFDGGIYGEFDQGGGDFINQVRYTFDAGNGIAISGGLEVAVNDDSYVPNLTGKVSVAQGWGGVDLFAAYDSVVEEYALKGIATFKASDAISLQVMATYGSGYSFYEVGLDALQAYEWSLGGAVRFQANEKLALAVGGQYFGDEFVTGANDWTVGATVDYNIVKNLDALLAVNYVAGDTAATDNTWNGFLRLNAAF
ncbi:porin [Mesorhizobium sp. ANAO-SY3R2]|uniref:porin n=1 Tax=Mesorhizobium sp. ANAO-SY3R2 TaxID=3166644 RepID=UPI00366B179E